MTDLADARESLAYWQTRERRLPRYAIRQRREARVLAARWEARIAAAERRRYGRGLGGALALYLFERRLPVTIQRSGRVAARRAATAVKLLAACTVALVVLAGVATIELLAAIVRAL